MPVDFFITLAVFSVRCMVLCKSICYFVVFYCYRFSRLTVSEKSAAVYLRKFFCSNTHTHTHPFNGPLSGTTQVSRYQKGKTNLDFAEARDSEWQWHQLGHMQVCTSLQADNHASTPLLIFFIGRMPFLPPNQQCQSTEDKFFCSNSSNSSLVTLQKKALYKKADKALLIVVAAAAAARLLWQRKGELRLKTFFFCKSFPL